MGLYEWAKANDQVNKEAMLQCIYVSELAIKTDRIMECTGQPIHDSFKLLPSGFLQLMLEHLGTKIVLHDVNAVIN